LEHAPHFNQADKIRAGGSGPSGRYRRVPLSYTHLPQHESSGQNLMPLKVLNGSFVFLCLCLRRERAEISSLPGFRIFLARIQPIFAGLEFSDHKGFSALCGARMQILP
jgi:hypothetical protein